MPRTPRHRSSFSALAALLLSCFSLAACTPADPLEAIRQQQQAGDFEGSLEPLRDLLKTRSDEAEIHYLYGRALTSVSQPSLAEWSLAEAMKDPEWLVPAGFQLAWGQLRAGNNDLAVATATRVLEEDPENLEVLLLRANAYAHSNKDEEKALEDAERLLSLDPDSVDAMEPKILALLGLERYEEAGEAIAELGERIQASGAQPAMEGWHCATAALFAFESGEIDDARERWEDCTERFPTHPNVLENAVGFYDAQRDFARSLELLRRSHEEAPASRDYRLNLTDRLRVMGEVEEAEALLREATESDQPSLALFGWIDLGQHYHRLERYDEASDAAEKALELARELGPPNPQLLLQVADARLIAGRHDEAWALTDEMTVEGHKHMVRARIAQERGDLREALGHFDEAFKHWPDNPWGRYYDALASERLGEFDRAIESYRYSIRLASEETDSKVRLARLLAAEQKPRDAMETLGIASMNQEPARVVDGELLSLHLLARLGQEEAVRLSLANWQRVWPQALGRAVATVAEGYETWGGAEAAVRVVRGAVNEGLSLSDPQQADALRLLVEASARAGQLDAVRAEVDAALKAQPDAAVFHELQGLWLERAGQGEAADRAYRKALDLDPKLAGALVGRGRVAAAADLDAALAHFDAALEADPDQVEAHRAAAKALQSAGNAPAAEARLQALLEQRSYDGAAARAIAESQLARGAVSEETVGWAERALRFGEGAEALDLLERVHRERGEAELAAAAADRARELRARLREAAERG